MCADMLVGGPVPMYLYLTTTGRVPGQPREIEIWLAQRDGRLYVVAERESDAIAPDEGTTDDEGLREAIWTGLDGVVDTKTKLCAVAKQPSESLLVVRCRNDEDLANTRQHEG